MVSLCVTIMLNSAVITDKRSFAPCHQWGIEHPAYHRGPPTIWKKASLSPRQNRFFSGDLPFSFFLGGSWLQYPAFGLRKRRPTRCRTSLSRNSPEVGRNSPAFQLCFGRAPLKSTKRVPIHLLHHENRLRVGNVTRLDLVLMLVSASLAESTQGRTQGF